MGTRKERDADDIEHARKMLAHLRPGDTLRTIVRHVTSSGMTRWISVLDAEGGEISDLSWAVAKVTGRNVNNRNHEGVECGGCGMDMGFDLVYSLSRALFPDGFDCIATDADDWPGRTCPSNDHVNHRGSANFPHHTEGGYALKQRWL